jgi:NADH-quinone oxidoreductase subunit A
LSHVSKRDAALACALALPPMALPSLVTYLAIAVLLVAALLLVTGRLSPRIPSAAKARPYESGVSEPITTQTRWPVRFALVGMLFLIFDVEALFFYPWAVIVRDLGWGGIVAVLSFFVVLGVGYLYARQRGALDWR